MPRSYMFTKEQVLDAAIELTREKGFSAVSARSLGDRLGTTSSPIFSHFENMADVQKGIIGAANKLYQSFREEEIKSGGMFRIKRAEWRISALQKKKKSCSSCSLCVTVRGANQRKSRRNGSADRADRQAGQHRQGSSKIFLS